MRRRPEAVLFDLDGTLVDSEPMHRAAWSAFFASRGRSVAEDFYRHRVVGRRGADVFRELADQYPGEDPETLLAEVLSHVPRVGVQAEVAAGAHDLLDGLTRAGVPLALVTSGTAAWAAAALAMLGGPAFDAVVTAEDVTAGKPDPEGFLLACSRLGVPAGAAAAVEDSPAGVAAARAAGVGLVVAVTTTNPPELLAEAHHVVAGLTGAAALLGLHP